MRGVAWFRLVVGVAFIGLLCNANAWAQTTTTTTTTHRRHHHHVVAETTTTTVSSSSEEQRLNALSGQVYNLQKQTNDNSSDIKQIEKQIVVAVPAPAGTAPATIGEHVGVAESNIAAIQKNLSDNLGISRSRDG